MLGGSGMTPTNAIVELTNRHRNVDVINPSLFAVTENGARVLYRLKNDVLQRLFRT